MRISDWSSDVCSSDLRQIEEGQEIAGLEMRAGLLEVGLALGVDQGRCRVGKAACRIGRGLMALRLDEDRPARAEAAEGVVEAAGDRDKFGRHGAVEARGTEAGDVGTRGGGRVKSGGAAGT